MTPHNHDTLPHCGEGKTIFLCKLDARLGCKVHWQPWSCLLKEDLRIPDPKIKGKSICIELFAVQTSLLPITSPTTDWKKGLTGPKCSTLSKRASSSKRLSLDSWHYQSCNSAFKFFNLMFLAVPSSSCVPHKGNVQITYCA